jgi:hypothetical protein
MDSESLNYKLEHNATCYLFASFGLCFASFKFAFAESDGRERQVEPCLKAFAVRGSGP